MTGSVASIALPRLLRFGPGAADELGTCLLYTSDAADE